MIKLRVIAVAVACALAAPAFAQSVDPEAWLDLETRQKLRQGMSSAQVEEIIGKPGRARLLRQFGTSAHDYEYRTRDGRNWMVTSFVDGRLAQYSVARLANPDRGGFETCQRREAWGRVQGNMKPEEVIGILGEPTSKAFAGGGMVPGESVTGFLYEFSEDPGDGAGTVMFGPLGVVGVVEPFCAVP